MSTSGEENDKNIRRYSHFELLRKLLVQNHPECIIPMLPQKLLNEKVISDDSEQIKHRMRKLQRFLSLMNENEILKEDPNFINFVRKTNFTTSKTSVDFSSIEDDSTGVSKMFKSIYNKFVMISGTDTTVAYKGTSEIDVKYDTDLTKLKTLKDFMTKLFDNTQGLQQILSMENENCRNIRSVISSVNTSIRSIDVDQNSVDDEINTFEVQEAEAKFDEISLSSGLKESKDIVVSESNNDAEMHNLLENMENGIDILVSAIDAVERRGLYKKAYQSATHELNNLDVNDESKRQEKLLEDKKEQLSSDIERIDSHLKEEIDKSIKVTEENTRNYIGKLVKIRKNHLEIQKDQWKKHI